MTTEDLKQMSRTQLINLYSTYIMHLKKKPDLWYMLQSKDSLTRNSALVELIKYLEQKQH